MLPLDGPEIPDAAADIGANFLCNVVGNLQPAVGHRLLSRSNRVMNKGAHLARLFPLYVIERIEILNLACEAGGKLFRIELLDIIRAILAIQKRRPCSLDRVAHRRNQTESGNHDATCQNYSSL